MGAHQEHHGIRVAAKDQAQKLRKRGTTLCEKQTTGLNDINALRAQGPVYCSSRVWIAGSRETKTLKPIDNVSLGETTSHRAVTTVNAKVASKVLAPKAESSTGGRRQHGGAEI